jgi:hypothetical protein
MGELNIISAEDIIILIETIDETGGKERIKAVC